MFSDTMMHQHNLKRGTDWAIVSHSHDEWQTETLENHAECVGRTAVQSIERAGEFYNLRCAVTGEFKIGRNWAETH
jgi:hypothetical protein